MFHTLSNKTKLINFEEWNVDQIVVQSLVLGRTLLRRPWKTLQELVPLRIVWKSWIPLQVTTAWEMGIKFSQCDRFSWFTGRFSWIPNVPGEWLSVIVAHAACVPVNSVSATKASSSTLCSTSASPNSSPKGPSCSKDSSSTSSMSSSSPNSANISSFKLREHLFLYMYLQEFERPPDHHLRHPRRQGLPIARFCFALALCAANFKPTITWKRNSTAIVFGDPSSVVKRFLFVKKVHLLQACLRIPMASVTSRWERDTAQFCAKISARTWTWTPQNHLITVKNKIMQSFLSLEPGPTLVDMVTTGFGPGGQ